jgi:TRAP-type C4-dicarboxylate transport system substrate-binding protein
MLPSSPPSRSSHLPGVGPHAPAAAPLEIKLATILPAGTSGHLSLMEMRDAWHKAAPAGVKLTVYAGSADGESLLVKKMRAGQIHAALISAVGLTQIDRSAACLQVMPLMFRDWREVDYVREKIRADLEARLRAKGFAVLFWADAGWVRYFSKKPAVHPADFKSMKMFVWAGEPQQLALLRNLGYQPVGLETEQILPSLQTGMIDVVPVPPFLANALQYTRAVRHMVDLNWVPIVGAAVVRVDTWEKLSPADRVQLGRAAESAGEKIRARTRQEDQDAIAAMRARGLTVHPATPEVAAEWQALAEQVYPDIRGAMVPADLFDRVRAHVAEFRAANVNVTRP